MKKFLLSLAATALCVSSAFADATITCKDLTVVQGGTATMNLPETFTQGDFTFNTAKGEGGSTVPSYNKAGDIRLYAKNTFEIKAPNDMTEIVFTVSTQGLKRLAPITASTGTIATQSVGDATVTWTGNAKDVVFTVGDKADFGSDGASKGGQLDFTVITITGGGSAEGGDEPPVTTDPNYFKATSVESGSAYVFVAGGKYNVSFDRNYGYMSAVNVTSEGDSFYGDEAAAMTFTAVEGGYTITTSTGRVLGAKAGFNTFDTTDESAANRVWTVTFAADGTATLVNVATGKTVAQDPQYGSFGCYDADALEGKVLPMLYKFNGSVTPPTPPTPTTTATFEQTASIASGSEYVLVVDGKVGAMINASYSYGRLNLTDATIADGKVTTDVANAITITASGEGYTLKDSEGRYLGFDGTHATSFQCYTEVNAFCVWDIQFTNGEALMTLTAEGVTGTVGVTKNATSGEWFTNIAPSVGADEIKLPTLYVKSGSTSVANIAVEDETAPVEFFNLQGVRVANPENGLYIRRQGNKVSKVYVR
mgnify:CR=1 FL=1